MMSETTNNTNRFRLRCLIRECGKMIFKYRVEEKVKPLTLDAFLHNPKNKQILDSLHEKHVITREQYECLYPDSGTLSIKDFDITLWLVLLRTFCCSRPYNDLLWYKSKSPEVNDFSPEADVVRIRDHKSKEEDAKGQELTDKSFKEKWDDLYQIIVRAGSGIDGLESRIKHIKDMEFDATKDEEVETDFMTWKKMEKEFEPGLDLSMCESKVFRLKLYSLLVDGGTRVFKHILDDKLPPSSLKLAIANNTSTIKFLEGKGVINATQHKLLYPSPGPPLSEDFDITLLAILLRNFCFKTRLPVWSSKGQPPVTDTSPEADIVRIREHRNEIYHLPKTRGLTEEEFEMMWEQITQTLLRLDSICSKRLPNLQEEIYQLQRNTIDPKREQELLCILDEWIKMDKEYESKIISTIMKHSASEGAIERSKETVRDVLDEKYFVRTEQFEKARTKLLENNIIVLNGAPGEGKTTVAKKLLVEVSKNERYIQLNTYSDWRFVILDNVEAVLIDDMFGSGIFDKEECRKWQKHIPSIASAVESKHLYVIITSRSYILTEAVEKMIVESFFTKENVVTLSSEDLTPKERKTILEKHFTKACYKNEEISELTEKIEHSILLQNIVELKLKSPDVSSTIGFPECARLFANNTDLYSEGVKFFKGPMACVKSNISGLLNDDDTFVAFFVLWAQTSRTLSSIDLELSIQETSDKVTKPICKLQFRPKDHIRKIRHSLHKHRGGFIHFDSTNEVFSFSHRVVQDSVGIVSFEKNTTAAIEFCDTTFIENFIRIGHHECDSGMHDIFMRKDKSSEGLDEQESSQGLTYYRETAQQKNVSSTENKSALLPWCVINLSQARYAQLSLQIGKLVIYPAFRTNELSMSPSKKLQKVSQYLDPTLFKHEVFKDKNFCDSFFRELNERNMLETILMVPVRTLDREFSEFKFLKMPSTEIRLPSYLIWAKEARSPLSDMCFHIIDSVSDFASKQELSMAMLISTKLGDCTLVKYFLEQGAEIDINMMSLALAANKEKMFEMLLGRHAVLNDEATFLHEICKVGYSEIVSKLIIKGVDIMQHDSSGLYPIHHAIQKGHLETVKVLLDNDESQAEVEFKPDTGKMSLFHFATEYQRMTIIDELLKRGKRPTKLDGKGRTPFLYSVYKRSTNVVHRMLQTAIEDGMQSHPDKDNCTPLYTALKNIVGHSARREECKIFEGIALELCKFTNNLHLVNSSGETPLKYACKNGLKAVAKEILKHGDPYENEGSTIFHHFVTADDRESIDTFLQLNIDPNIHDKYHRTPLMLANVLGKKMVIRVLKKDRRILDYHKEIGMVEDRLELPDRNVNTRSLSSLFEGYTDPEPYRRVRRRRREYTAYDNDYDDDLLVYD